MRSVLTKARPLWPRHVVYRLSTKQSEFHERVSRVVDSSAVVVAFSKNSIISIHARLNWREPNDGVHASKHIHSEWLSETRHTRGGYATPQATASKIVLDAAVPADDAAITRWLR